ncbi:MAG: hypothetical protein GYA35_09160, partial [Thermoanaerobaculaceae bacterium]|nr:hypothetical protein [Thermoanaerobaculaceae bacterium]
MENKSNFLLFNQIVSIAKNTYKESIRSRIFYILMAFAILILGFAVILSFLTIGSQKRVILDLGLA